MPLQNHHKKRIVSTAPSAMKTIRLNLKVNIQF